MLKNIHLFTLLGLILSGNILHCAQASDSIASSATQVEVAITLAKKHICNYPECTKSFSTSSNLITHKRTHTGEKKFQCNQCEKSFTRLHNLTSHKHIHTGEKDFKCDQCDNSFTQSYNLKIHKRIHTNENPFKCDQCGKPFTNRYFLKRHKQTHTGEKPFKCDECNIAFTKNDNLIQHRATKKHQTNVMLAYAALASAQDFTVSQSSNSPGNELLNTHQEITSIAITANQQSIATEFTMPSSDFNIFSPPTFFPNLDYNQKSP